MSLRSAVRIVNGRPILTIGDVPTTEFWCYGDPNAIEDFAAAGLRICQFHVPFPSWWSGPGTYDFAPTDQKIEEFLAKAPGVLLIPRVNFGYVGEAWWAKLHPDQLAVGRDLDGNPVDYEAIRVRPVDCWFSSGSELWTREAAAAMQAFVEHCEQRFPEHVIGYQIGGGISAEWFRWWNFTERVYEDYSRVAQDAFRAFLRRRYATDDALQSAWHRTDVTLETATVPAPRRLHEPLLTFFRNPFAERDVIDWLECLSHGNSSQIIALATAAKRACSGRRIVGTFYGYFWPHWNTQSAARSGHLDLQRMLQCEEIDFISSPYHYDNRHCGGFHHSQTVPQTIEHAGKLHVDEIDTFTHLVDPTKTGDCPAGVPRDAAQSCALLRRDAATVLGTAGTAWWMDLHSDRWYADRVIQQEVLSLQQLCRQAIDWSCESHAQVALVVDDRSYALSSLWNPLNQYFSSMGRQFAWSDAGFPIDTVMPWEITTRQPYRVYVFLNCWRMSEERRQEVIDRVRRPNTTAIWFYGSGLYGDTRWGADCISELIGMRVRMAPEPATPEIEILPESHDLVGESQVIARGPLRFGVDLPADRASTLIAGKSFNWKTAAGPRFFVDDPKATVLGRNVADGEPGLAMIETNGWRSIYCGAPLLPGWLLRRIASFAGVHRYTSSAAQVFHRGPLLSVYKPGGGHMTVEAPPGKRIRPLVPALDQAWQPDPSTEPLAQVTLTLAPDETRFFLAG